MVELLSALADALGVYLLYFIGKFTLFFCTVGYFRAEPLKGESSPDRPPAVGRVVSKKHTMLLGFVVLILIVAVLAFQFAPENAF